MENVPAEIIDAIILFVGPNSRRSLRMVSRIFAAKIHKPNLLHIDLSFRNRTIIFKTKCDRRYSEDYYIAYRKTPHRPHANLFIHIAQNDQLVPLLDIIYTITSYNINQTIIVVCDGQFFNW